MLISDTLELESLTLMKVRSQQSVTLREVAAKED